jgi:proteasome lid subunit RPN8/RPN11
MELNTQAQQREAVVQGRSLSPYRLRYTEAGRGKNFWYTHRKIGGDESMIAITEGKVAEINRQGEQEYPNECCGALIGRVEDGRKIVIDIIPISNKREPEAKHNRFLIRPEEFLECEKTARKQKLDLIGFYHSHPDHLSLPSGYDLEHALPVYSYIIISVELGKAAELTSWLLRGDRSQFDREEVAVILGTQTTQI